MQAFAFISIVKKEKPLEKNPLFQPDICSVSDL